MPNPKKLDPSILQDLAQIQVHKGMLFAEQSVLYSYTYASAWVDGKREYQPEAVAIAISKIARLLQPEIEKDLRKTSGLFAGE